jgi:hypothetical protein
MLTHYGIAERRSKHINSVQTQQNKPDPVKQCYRILEIYRVAQDLNKEPF